MTKEKQAGGRAHPATRIEAKRAPHPATVVQTKTPHPATAARAKAPHPATVAQTKLPPPIRTAQRKAPHSATTGRVAHRIARGPTGSIQRMRSSNTNEEQTPGALVRELATKQRLSPEQATAFWKTIRQCAKTEEIIGDFYSRVLSASSGEPWNLVDPAEIAGLMDDVLADYGGDELCYEPFALITGTYDYTLTSVKILDSGTPIHASDIHSRWRGRLNDLLELISTMPTQAYADEESAIMLAMISSAVDDLPEELQQILASPIIPVNRSAAERSFLQVLRMSGGSDETTCNQEARVWLLESINYYLGKKKS